jgi:trehalose 6-phosphate phosphatase
MADSPPPPALLEGAALFLDFDGTLVELAEAPDAIDVPEALHALLERLSARLEGRLALVSGRAVADLERHLGSLVVAVAGSHGLELRLPGAAAEVKGAGAIAGLRDDVAAFAAERPGLLVEEKPGAIALHYRQAPELEREVQAHLAALAERNGLRLQHGKMVAELLPLGTNKGEALRRLMREPPFAGGRPVFVGDDLTDEHGFEVAAALGGGGVLVGAPRETAARWRLPDVAAVWRWLEAAA